MQTIEIYTPIRDEDGKFIGLNHEAIFYDPEALVEPMRIVRNLIKINEFADEKRSRTSSSSASQTIFPIDGMTTPVSPGRRDTVRDSGHVRPAVGARSGSKYFEQGMSRPGAGEDTCSTSARSRRVAYIESPPNAAIRDIQDRRTG